MKTLFTVAALAALVLAASADARVVGNGASLNGIWENGIWENGVWQNGIWENGTDYQGVNMQGTRLHGRPGKATISSTSLVRVELPR